MPGFPQPTDEQRCTAHTRKGTRCPKFRVKGTNVCLAHGAKAPHVREAARRRVQEQETRELAARIDVPLPEFKSAADAAGYVVREMTKRAAQFGALADQLGDSVIYTDRTGVERLRAAVTGQRQALDSLTKVLAAAAAAEQSGRDEKAISDDAMTDIIDAAHAAFNRAVWAATERPRGMTLNLEHPQEPPWSEREIRPADEAGFILMAGRGGNGPYPLRVLDLKAAREIRAEALDCFHAFWRQEWRWRLAEAPDRKRKRLAHERDKAQRAIGSGA